MKRRIKKQMRNTSSDSGFTLIEIMVAFSIFALVLVVLGQALVRSNAAMEMQREKILAAQECAAIFQNMRNTRDDSLAAYPGSITNVWAQDAVINDDDQVTLHNGSIRVTYDDPDATLLEVSLTYTWLTLSGTTATYTAGTALSRE